MSRKEVKYIGGKQRRGLPPLFLRAETILSSFQTGATFPGVATDGTLLYTTTGFGDGIIDTRFTRVRAFPRPGFVAKFWGESTQASTIC